MAGRGSIRRAPFVSRCALLHSFKRFAAGLVAFKWNQVLQEKYFSTKFQPIIILFAFKNWQSFFILMLIHALEYEWNTKQISLRGLSTTTSIFPQVQFSLSFNITVFYISSIQYMSIKKIEPHVFSQLGFKKTPFLPFFNTCFKVGGDNSLPNYSLHTSYTCFEVLQSKRHSMLKIYIYIIFLKKSVITLKFETLHVKCAIFRYIGNPQLLSSKCICKNT